MKLNNLNKNIVFRTDDKAIITLSPEGITVHRENFPEWKPDDFVVAIIDKLENSFRIKFYDKRDKE